METQTWLSYNKFISVENIIIFSVSSDYSSYVKKKKKKQYSRC